MSQASVTIPFGDGEHTFRLAIGELRELQDKVGIGPAALLDRLAQKRWLADDARETIRLGLIGAGLDPLQAMKLVRRYVDERPWGESVPIAVRILVAAIIGPAEDPAGKHPAEEAATQAEPIAASPSPPSTDLVQPLGGLPEKSID